MKRELLQYLRCPCCKFEFDLSEFELRNSEIIEGLLCCKGSQGHVFPILRSIPRLITDTSVWEAEFSEQYKDLIDKFGSINSPDVVDPLQDGTRRSFGFEWTNYDVQRAEEDRAYFRAKTGVSEADLEGKLVLDAGCGSGRYAKVAGESAGVVIGVDLSSAVETAYTVTKELPNVHLIQGDILNLPFASGIFDFIFSIGVLHHTPNTKKSLDCLIPLLKPGGEIAVWLYPRWPFIFELYNSLLRSITTRLSLNQMHKLAVFLEPIGQLKLHLLTSPSLWQRIVGQILRAFTIGISYHPDREIRICDTFDWFSPPYQWHHTVDEVREWLRMNGLLKIEDLSVGQDQYQFNYGNGVNLKAHLPDEFN